MTSSVKRVDRGFISPEVFANPVLPEQRVTDTRFSAAMVITKMDLVVHPVIHRAKRVRGRKITTVLPATAELICPAVNVLTALPMQHAEIRHSIAKADTSNPTMNALKKNKNRQRRTRSTLVRHA